MNHVSYDLAKRLKEAGVEQWAETGQPVYDWEGKQEIWLCDPEKMEGYAKAHTSDQLKAAIHAEKGYGTIEVVGDGYWVWVNCYSDQLAPAEIGSCCPRVHAEASTEDKALASCLIQILEAKKPKTCGECVHPYKQEGNPEWKCFSHPNCSRFGYPPPKECRGCGEANCFMERKEDAEACPNFKEA